MKGYPVPFRPHVFVLAALVVAASFVSVQMIDVGRTSSQDVSTDAVDEPPVQPVNAIVGDAGFASVFGRMPEERTPERIRIATHLAYVDRRLRGRPVDHLTPDQARRRAEVLDHLRTYRLAGEFPRNTTHVGRRTPVFVDGEGRICAVGYLIRQTAGSEVVRTVNDRFRFSRISEMDTPLISQWAEHHGFNLHELEMIQPAYCWRDPDSWGCDGAEEDETWKVVEVAAIGANVGSALLNGWMVARSDRNLYVAGGERQHFWITTGKTVGHPTTHTARPAIHL